MQLALEPALGVIRAMDFHDGRSGPGLRQLPDLGGGHLQDDRAFIDLAHLLRVRELQPVRPGPEIDDEAVEDVGVDVREDVLDLANLLTVAAHDIRARLERQVRDPLAVIHAASITATGLCSTHSPWGCSAE